MGPFTIMAKLGPVTYQLDLPKTWKIHNKFHLVLLIPVEENSVYRQHFKKPPPDLIHGEEEWEIEAILKHRTKRRKTEYLIHWKGYPSSERTWQKEQDFDNAKELLDEYKEKYNLS